MFETDDSIAIFEEFVKQQGGKDNLKVNSDYQGKLTHSAVAIGLKYFQQVTQKRLIKTVRFIFMKKIKSNQPKKYLLNEFFFLVGPVQNPGQVQDLWVYKPKEES